ncbi:hypothetical protein M3J09_013789 [Ascochyta lentis]
MAPPYTGEKGSIPVLAYLASPTPLSLSCSMFILHATSNVASIVVNIPVLLDGLEAEQTFVAQYDPDNIQSAIDDQGTADRHVPTDRLSLEPNSALHTLSLQLKHECLLWYPHHQPITAKPGSEAAFRELLGLVQATSVHFVYDNARLRHSRTQEMFTRFVSKPGNTNPFQSKPFFKKRSLVQGNWIDLAPTNIAPSADDAPPAYPESSDKRRSPVLGSSLPSSPPQRPSKMPQDDPSQELIQSDTEIATDNSYLDHQHDILEEDDDTRHLPQTPKLSAPATTSAPAATSAIPLSAPIHPTQQELLEAIRTEVDSAVERFLPKALDKIFSFLAFTVASPTNQDAANRQPSNLLEVEAHILPYILDRIREYPRLNSIQNYIDEAHKIEERCRTRTELSFDDELEDYRVNIQELSEQKLGDLEREGGKALDNIRNASDAIEDEVTNALQTSHAIDTDAKIAASTAQTNMDQAARKAIQKVDDELAESVRDAFDRVHRNTHRQVCAAERRVDRIMALKLGAWRRRIFHRSTHEKRRGPLAYMEPKGKSRSVAGQSIELPDNDESTTEDEVAGDNDGTSTVEDELSSDGDSVETTDDEL